MSEDPTAQDDAADAKDCPLCGETIKKAARKCKFCGEYLDKSLKPGHRSASADLQRRKAEEWPNAAEYVLCILCSCIGIIVALVYLMQGYTKKGGLMLVLSVVFLVVGGAMSFLFG